MTPTTPALIEVVHPITGAKLLMREDFVDGGVWLPPCAKDIDATTITSLRAELNVPLFAREVVLSVRHKEAAVPKSA